MCSVQLYYKYFPFLEKRIGFAKRIFTNVQIQKCRGGGSALDSCPGFQESKKTVLVQLATCCQQRDSIGSLCFVTQDGLGGSESSRQ